ncbi:tyrosine-type recombinase/integrase [Candidatus Woesearchaeota archaeon]|nr:tyrosine-type recombinase/integrase [Candidatus Woesearchaeota archaeon]
MKPETVRITTDLEWGGRLSSIEKYLNNEGLSHYQRKIMKEFEEYNQARNLSISSRYSYCKVLKLIGVVIKKDYRKYTKKDINYYFANIKNQHQWKKTPLSKDTIWGYQTVLIKFFDWLEMKELSEYIKEIRVKRARNGTLKRENILTEEDIKLLIDSCRTLRDKCLISVLYESTCRLGEISRVKIEDISFDDYGAEMIIKHSKTETGKRIIPLIDSAPILKEYINQHPYSEDENAPLWINMVDQGYRKIMGYKQIKPDSIRAIVRSVAKRSGIKKRVFCHLFRHSRTTNLLKDGFSDQMVQKLGGWSDSQQLGRYGHLVSSDIKDELLKRKGIKEMDVKKSILEPKRCSRCQELNEAGNKYCKKCWLALDVETAMEQSQAENKMQVLVTELIKKLKKEDVQEIIKGIT